MNKIIKFMSTKKNTIIVIILLVISPFIYNQIISIQNKKIDYNKKRLIDLSISREKIFWECHGDKLKIETDKWLNSEDYAKQNTIYQQCLNDTKTQNTEKYQFTIGRLSKCRDVEPDNRWNQNNEIASQYCSRIADESDDGQLRDKFRKKVPIAELTNNEIDGKIKDAIK